MEIQKSAHICPRCGREFEIETSDEPTPWTEPCDDGKLYCLRGDCLCGCFIENPESSVHKEAIDEIRPVYAARPKKPIRS